MTDGAPDRTVLVTGGAGFVGANLCVGLARRHPDWEVIAVDSLRRRGSELQLQRLRASGVRFEHGDVRELTDLDFGRPVDALVECSAEPSALAGTDGSPQFAVQTNLLGACNCLELCRLHDAQIVFLSTSRVYPTRALDSLNYEEMETRFDLVDAQELPGASAEGISERFPLDGARTLYGATKLAAELLIEEYAVAYDLDAVVDRCGVIAGPWQMGKVDQGIFSFWMLAHYFKRELAYIGYGGTGKQVRDLLHVDDLVALVEDQLIRREEWRGKTVNVGGGRENSLSLRETTALCEEITGHSVRVRGESAGRPGDIRIYISDCAQIRASDDWHPTRPPRDILADLFDWIRANEGALERALMG